MSDVAAAALDELLRKPRQRTGERVVVAGLVAASKSEWLLARMRSDLVRSSSRIQLQLARPPSEDEYALIEGTFWVLPDGDEHAGVIANIARVEPMPPVEQVRSPWPERRWTRARCAGSSPKAFARVMSTPCA